MNARIVTTATLFTAFAGVLTATAADSQLLSYVMPDAKVVAGVNVDQAKASPFGLYVLTQMQSNNSGLKDLIALTNFDPTRDVHELLAATTATANDKTPTGLAIARGNFDIATITAFATGHGALSETYKGVNILEDPKKTAGVAFINASLVLAGDLANVKAAIDRPSTGQALPTSVVGQVNQWSNASDAWVITTVPPGTLAPATAIAGNMTPLLQQVQQASAGVKFGNTVVGTAVVQIDTAANALQMANALQFLINLAQMQASNDPTLSTLSKAVTITNTGNSVKLVISLPQAKFQELIDQHAKSTVLAPSVVKKN